METRPQSAWRAALSHARAGLAALLFAWLIPSAAAQLSLPNTGIPQLTPGQLSTVAGKPYSAAFGYSGDGGPATSAEMSSPQGVALDAAGNLYIADSSNGLVRVVNRQPTAITILGITVMPGDIQTIAGIYSSTYFGGFAGDGGPATHALLNFPDGLLFDKNGNLYIADSGNGRVRVINMQSQSITVFGVTIQPGDIDTVAGDTVNSVAVSCASSTDNIGDGCPATQADLFQPVSLAFDSAGNLYIDDDQNFDVRMVSATTGIISNVAGDGIDGYAGDGGNPEDAELWEPHCVQLDADNNIYISEMGSNRVRVINTQSTPITLYGVTIQPGTIQTVAGSGTTSGYSGDGGPANQAVFNEPKGIFLDPAGDLYIADFLNGRIRVVNVLTGIVTTIAGDGGGLLLGEANANDGPATSAVLRLISYLAMDFQGDLFFSTDATDEVDEISARSAVLDFPSTIPSQSSAPESETLQNIGNETLDISNITLEGTDSGDFSDASTCGSSLAPGASCTISATFSPLASGNLSATISIDESSAGTSQTILLNGIGSSTAVATLSVSATQLSFGNQAIGTTSAAQTVTLSNIGTGPFTPQADESSFLNITGNQAGDFTQSNNCGVSLSPGSSCTITVNFLPDAPISATAFLSFTGPATNSPQLVQLTGTGTGPAGSGSSTAPFLQIIPGTVETIAGDGYDAGIPDAGGYLGMGGPAVGATLQGPTGVAHDPAGNIYIADGNNNVILFVNLQNAPVTVAGVTTQPGDIQTVVGNGYGAGINGGGYSGDGGPALSAELNQPIAVTLDKAGNIYFTDLNNYVVRIVNTQPTSIVVNGVTIAPNDIQTIVGSVNPICGGAKDVAGDGCPATSARLNEPYQIAFDTAGNLYVADSCDMVVRAVNMGSATSTIAGVSIAPGQIEIVAGTLASDAGIQGCTKPTASGDGGPALSAVISGPYGLAVDSAGNLYIGDLYAFTVRAVNTQSTSISVFGVTIPPGDIQTVVGNGTPGYVGDFGPATAAEVSIVYTLKFDPAGNLYLADVLNNVVRVVFASTGIIRTVAGNGYGAAQWTNRKETSYTGAYAGDGGAATSAEFYGPADFAIDPQGNMSIADLFNKVIRQVSATAAGYIFPPTQVGLTSASQIYTLSNIGTQTVTLTGLTVGGNFKQVPSGLTDCTSTISLPSGATCQLALAFAPATIGLLNGQAKLTYNLGAQTIQLSGEGIPGPSDVLESLTVTPAGASLAKGSTRPYTATATYSNASTQNITTSVTWSSSKPSVATIGIGSGVATGLAAGSTQITATIGTISSPPVTLTVTAPTLITPTVTVSPSPSTITSTQALAVTVTVSGGSGNPAPTGSVILTSGSYTSAAATLTGGNATINIPAGSLAAGTDTLSVSYTPGSTSSSIYNSATGSNTVTVTIATVQVTVSASPVGLSFSVDGTSYTSTQTLTWNVGSSHTLATISPQTAAGTQNTFASWSDRGAISHSVTAPTSTTTYTATFITSYQLTTAASPAADGTVTPASGSYYASGTMVNLTATPNTGFSFVNWTDNVASSNSASTTITMSAPEIVTANFSKAATPLASLTPTLTFTNTVVGTTSSALFATLSNSGNATLNISGIAIGGTNPSDFAISTGTNACGATLAADASCSIYVMFTPASATSFSATLTVTDNATPTTQSATLTGTGTPAPAPIATLTPTLTFPNTSVGTTSSALLATLSNTGNATLNISSIVIGGTNPSDFAIATGSNACGTTLAADASCSIYVTFTPASAAGFSASLQVADNASGSPQSTTLTGTGTPPPAPIVALTPATLTFTAVSGTTTASQTATLSNTGNATLNISGITIAGTNPSDFSVTTGSNACGSTLAADASCSIYITFTPASATSFSASLEVADNASGSPQSTTLSGTGTPPPTFTVTSTSGAQTIQPGGTATYTITVTPQNGSFSNAVALSVSGLPTGATGTFAPPSVTPGSAPASSTLTIQMPSTATASARHNFAWPLAAPALALVSLLFLPGKRRRRWITLALLLFASLGAFTALTACGGGFTLKQPAQIYTITVTGTSGTDVQTTTVQLTVQ